MPILKQCSWHGCTKIIEDHGKYCPYHEKLYGKEERERHKNYSSYRTDKKEQAFYNDDDWDRIKASVKSMQNGMDLFSYYVLNKVEEGQTCHHIIELKEDWSRRLDIDNLIYLTESNHQKIHKLYKKSQTDKKRMQQLLFSFVERYYKEFGS